MKKVVYYSVPASKRLTEAKRNTPYIRQLPEHYMLYMSDYLVSHESTYIDTKAYQRVTGSKAGIKEQYSMAYDYNTDLLNTVFKDDSLEVETRESLTVDETQFDTDLELQALQPYGDASKPYAVGDFVRICLPMHLLSDKAAKIEAIREADGKLLVFCLYKSCRMYVSKDEIVPYNVQ